MALIIIGKVLLTLLIIVVLLLFLLLFFPISYRLYVKRKETKTELKVYLRWLFGFIQGRYHYPEPNRLQVFLLWKELTTFHGTKRRDKSSSNEKKKKVTNTIPSPTETSNNENSIEVKEEGSITNDNKRKTQRKPNLFDKLKNKAKQITDKYYHIKENVGRYTSILKEDNTKVLLGDIFTEVKRFIKYLKPKKQRANLTIGTGSPDTTGYLYGIVCMYSHLLGPDVNIYPDFENKIFEGELELSGRITVFMLGMIILRLYRNQNLPEFLDKFKKKEA